MPGFILNDFLYGCRVQPMGGWGSLLQPCVGDSVCPLFLSSLMNEQQKSLPGIPCSQSAGVGSRVEGQPCANISLHVGWLDHTFTRYA